MKKATKEDVDKFMELSSLNEDIYPYLTTTKHLGIFDIREDDWSGFLLTNDSLSFMLEISIQRSDDNGFNIALYSLNAFAAGRAILIIKELIRRYSPRYIDTTVHSSNTKSIAFNEKLGMELWGTKPMGAWNMKLGEYEDLLYFRKLLK